LFITFEGPEGSGKSTQIALLCQALCERGYQVLQTREPGGTPIAEQIREVIHNTENTAMLPSAEALLYSAARAQHVAAKIVPALAEGTIVISDRYAQSTMAYQGYGHGLDLEELEAITRFATGGLQPDLIIYLDLPIEDGLGRKLRDREQGKGEWNRMDQLKADFYRRVRQGYLLMAEEDPGRWLIIDASLDIDTIHATILDSVERRLADRD